MKVSILKGNVSGVISAPPSKSYAHRYLIASMLSSSLCKIDNIYLSEDILATINCIKELGYDVNINNNQVIINKNDKVLTHPILNCNESGSTLRFLIPIALTMCDNVTFCGTKRLLERGISVYEELFIKHNIQVIKNETSITFKGKLKEGIYEIKGNISSQYITGLVFALSFLSKESVIKIIPPIESKPYIDITLDVLRKFNINLSLNDNQILINKSLHYKGCNNVVEGDYSNAAFIDAFNYLNGNVSILNLNENSLQGDKIYKDHFDKLNQGNCVIDISNCIDLGPVLFAFASLKYGATFKGTSRLKIKESDRAKAMQIELAKAHVDVIINDDEVIVKPISKDIDETINFDSFNDHRIAMAESLFLTRCNITISNAEAVKKSYPNYFDDLIKLGVKISYDIE